MSANLENCNIAYWYADESHHRCGYCSSTYGSVSHGMTVPLLNVHDYQELIDRGWRRSGKYCYKPVMDKTCCPQYTIRCKPLELALSKSQKKVLKRFNNFLNDGVLTKQEARQTEAGDAFCDIFMRDVPSEKLVDRNTITFDPVEHSVLPEHGVGDVEASVSLPSNTKEVPKEKEIFKKGVGADSSRPPTKKAKLLRLERKKEKLLKRGVSLETIQQQTQKQQQQKSLEDFINEVPKNAQHKLKLKLIPTSCPGSEWKRSEPIEFALYKKYQSVIHNDPPEKCTLNGFIRFLVSSPLKITIERMHKTHKLFKQSAKLFEKYQIFVHNESPDDCDEESYYDFLVKSPLKPCKFPNDVEGPGFGSFHQQYWIDDKLIAVGVVDILPKCVSSVYFFYDPDYRSLTLGTYGSLRELEFSRRLHAVLPSIECYYMGYYIHSCPKMRYKGKLSPSYLLCPETYQWFHIEKCTSKLDRNKYSRLNDDLDALDVLNCANTDIDNINVIVKRQQTKFKFYKLLFKEQELFDTIGKLIGKRILNNFLFQVVD